MEKRKDIDITVVKKKKPARFQPGEVSNPKGQAKGPRKLPVARISSKIRKSVLDIFHSGSAVRYLAMYLNRKLPLEEFKHLLNDDGTMTQNQNILSLLNARKDRNYWNAMDWVAKIIAKELSGRKIVEEVTLTAMVRRATLERSSQVVRIEEKRKIERIIEDEEI